MKKYYIILICLFSVQMITGNTFGQARKQKIVMTLLDSLSKTPLEFATVGIFHVGDSAAFRYTLSFKNGKAELEALDKGEYTIKIEYVGYNEILKSVVLNGGERVLDIGTILMSVRPMTVDDITVVGDPRPIVVKGDSTIFNAKYFNPAPNDYLENLLNKMPGLEVTSAGIYFNGKMVTSLTVEGKPFFSEDQSIALGNLPAYAVKTVSIHGKKPKYGTFSGMENDANTPLALDVRLKDDMKKGIIANLLAGYGSEGKYRAKGFMGRFAEKMQYAVIGELNNTSTMTSSPTAKTSKMSSKLMPTSELTGFSRLSSPGIVRTITGGADYSMESDKNAKSNALNANVSYKNTDSYVEEDSYRETYIPDGIINNKNNNKQSVQGDDFAFRADDWIYFRKSKIILNFTPALSYSKQKSDSRGDYSTKINDKSTNEGQSRNYGVKDNVSFSGDLNLSKSWEKRSLHAYFSFGFDDHNDKLNNNSQTKFDDEGTTSQTTINQLLKNSGNAYSVRSDIAFTQSWRLVRGAQLSGFLISYKPIIEQSVLDQTAYYFNEETNKYDLVDSNGTGYIKSRFMEHTVGVTNKFVFRAWTVNLGLDFSPSLLTNYDSRVSQSLKSEWRYNYSPVFSIFKIVSRGFMRGLRIDYVGRTQQPTINQLQPIVNNTNPLFIRSGNINLTPEFHNNLKVELGIRRAGHLDLSSRMIKDKIVYKTDIDSLGVKRSFPINENGSFNVGGGYSYSKYFFNNKFGISNRLSCSYNKNVSYTNDVKYSSKNINATERITLSFRKQYIFTNVSFTANYSNSRYSIETMESKSQWSNSVTASLNCSLPFKMNLITDLAYNFYIGYKYDNKPAAVWNLELSRQLFNNRCVLSVKGYDLLNQAKNLKVNYGDDYMEEISNNTIKQYFMLNFSWRFGKFGI